MTDLYPDNENERIGSVSLPSQADPDQQRGLYGKYRVEKVNGKPTGRVFILAYDNDPHARVALAAYADSCQTDFPQLATDLRAEIEPRR